MKGKTLKDKGNVWQSNVNWIFENSNDGKLIYIKNEHSNRFLTADDTSGSFYTSVMEEIFEEGNSNQLWIQGNATTEGFFTLKNYGLKKFLTAQTENTLITYRKFIIYYLMNTLSLVLFSLKNLSRLQATAMDSVLQLVLHHLLLARTFIHQKSLIYLRQATMNVKIGVTFLGTVQMIQITIKTLGKLVGSLEMFQLFVEVLTVILLLLA